MGQEQSSRSAKDGSSFEPLSSSNVKRETAGKASSSRLVVVNRGGRSEENVPDEIAKLNEIPMFYPILRSNLNLAGLNNSPDIRTKVCPIPVCNAFDHFEIELRNNAQFIADQQRALAISMRKVGGAISMLKTDPQEAYAQYVRLYQEMARCDSISTQVDRLKAELENAIQVVRQLNNTLRVEDRLEDFVVVNYTGVTEPAVEVQRVIDIDPPGDLENASPRV